MGLLKPNQVLNKAYRQVAIETTDFDLFKNALRTLRDNIVDGQREHTQKEHLRNFLSETFYKPYYMAPGKSSVSCPLKPSDSAPLKHSTMPP